jgi:ketosteroid isomerase-like protein
MMRRFFFPLLLVLIGTFTTLKSTAAPTEANTEQLRLKVTAVETAFAKTMADRDFKAFSAYVSEEAVFLNGGNPLRGKGAVLEHWKKFFASPKPPFAWKPDLVEVLASGTLAESIGSVFDSDGKPIARYYSTWRLEAPNTWRIVFDNGYDLCQCQKP